jgi:hypothetical protein
MTHLDLVLLLGNGASVAGALWFFLSRAARESQLQKQYVPVRIVERRFR